MQSNQKVEIGSRTVEDSFITIDDLIPLADILSKGLIKLGEYKYPLDIRKGVRSMSAERENITIKAIGRTYFLDVKETKDGNPFLIITESRSKGEGNDRERSSILVFQDNLKEFAEAVSSIANKIGH
ncbi:MAG: DUF3276 family protein [Anaerolineales bacterium]|nr:DUF3276 family protein [Anaerolineales bacterium]